MNRKYAVRKQKEIQNIYVWWRCFIMNRSHRIVLAISVMGSYKTLLNLILLNLILLLSQPSNSIGFVSYMLCVSYN